MDESVKEFRAVMIECGEFADALRKVAEGDDTKLEELMAWSRELYKKLGKTREGLDE